MWLLLGGLQPGGVADRDRHMGHRTLRPGTVPVLLARRGGHGVADTNASRWLTAQLHEAFALDDVQDLAPAVTVPVVAGAGLEANDAHADGVGIERHEQWVGAGRPREMSWVHGLAVQRLSSCGDLHGVMVRAGTHCCLHEFQWPGASEQRSSRGPVATEPQIGHVLAEVPLPGAD